MAALCEVNPKLSMYYDEAKYVYSTLYRSIFLLKVSST